jgi:DNA-binding transcriptional regulator YiaG
MTREEVRIHRTKLGLSQLRLAALARVSRFKLTLWESGQGPLTEVEVKKIHTVLVAEAAARLIELRGLVGQC